MSETRLLVECPLGTRFKYLEEPGTMASMDGKLAMPSTFVLLSRADTGVVAKWNGVGHNAPIAAQEIFSAAETEDKLKAMTIEIVE